MAMNTCSKAWVASVAFALGSIGTAAAAGLRAPCDDSLTQRIPQRAPDAPGGRAFAAQLQGLSDNEREARVAQQLLSGNIPGFLRHLLPVRLEAPASGGGHTAIVICAAPDYLAIGSDEDYLLIPMRLGTALSTASHFDLSLPTPRIVDAIYAQATIHLAPEPLPAGDAMRSTDYYWHHNELIRSQRTALAAPPGALSAGQKKDLVLTERLWDHLDRVAIYGWHLAAGQPIQPLSTVHGWRYEDYSHGARLISTRVFVDGQPRSLFELLQLPALAGALNSGGAITNLLGLIDTLSARARCLSGAPCPQGF
jgi:hypothetical protein